MNKGIMKKMDLLTELSEKRDELYRGYFRAIGDLKYKDWILGVEMAKEGKFNVTVADPNNPYHKIMMHNTYLDDNGAPCVDYLSRLGVFSIKNGDVKCMQVGALTLDEANEIQKAIKAWLEKEVETV